MAKFANKPIDAMLNVHHPANLRLCKQPMQSK